MLSPEEILAEIRENLKVYISPVNGVKCTSWTVPLDNGVKYQATLNEIPLSELENTELMVRELFNITIDQLIEDAQNGEIQ